MKTIYECEKCGHKSGDWDEIRKCEREHIDPWTVESGSRWGHSELYPEYASTIIVNMRNGEQQAVYVLDEDATNELQMAIAIKQADDILQVVQVEQEAV